MSKKSSTFAPLFVGARVYMYTYAGEGENHDNMKHKDMMNISSRINRFVIALIGVMVLSISSVYAGTAYSDGRAYLRQGSPTGAGKVYVSTSSSTPAASSYKACNTVQTSETTTPSAAAQVKGEKTKTTYHFWAVANAGYIFTGWYDSNGNLLGSGAAHVSGSVTSGQAGGSDTHAYLDYHASFIKQIQMSFITPTNGSYTITHCGTEVTPAYSSFTTEGKVVLTAMPADGYKLRGWYTSTNGGVTKKYVAFGTTYEPNFTSNVTIGADFVADDGKATFWNKNNGKIYNDLNTANSEASNGHVIVAVSDGVLGAGTYTIKAGVTLLIPFDETYNLMTTPKVNHMASGTSSLFLFRKLTLAPGAVINCSGNICVGGQMASVNGGRASSYPMGACGMLDLSRGGTINLKSGAVLYAWGFVKGQDMEQGNNTEASGVGKIVAESGATVWEDFQVGEWRGGTASETIYNNKSSWKFFPFQSYTIQNVEAPVEYQTGSKLKCYWAIFGNGQTFTVPFTAVGASADKPLFVLGSGGTMKKWYDPTTDRVCYELGGGASIDAISLSVMGQSVSSSDYYLPIPANMHIALRSGCTLNLTKAMTMHAGSVVEVKSGATLNINARVHMFDQEDWGTYCMYAYYFRTYRNLTSHYNRGDGTSKANLEDATLVVDGTVNVGAQMLYATAHGANICGNGGGTFVYGTLPGNTTMTQCKELKDNVSVNIRSANLHNDNASYTKGIAATTFKNINGRWFSEAASTIKSNKTYDFTYIKSGDVYGTGGTNALVAACYSKDKTGLVLQDKWANVKKGCSSKWFDGIDDGHLYNYSLNKAWHQYIKTGSFTTGTGEDAETTNIYAGSDGKLLYETDCDFEEVGEIDENCLYPVDDVQKALVDGAFVAVTANASPDHGYHATASPTTYYLCFDGCVWHPATRNAENRYTVSGTTYIWYGDQWLAVQYDSSVSLYYSLSATNVKIYYEYVNNAWVLATPVAEVTTSAGTEQVYSLGTAVSKAASGGTNVTIRLLKNISGTINYTTGNNCGLDLNGFTLSSSTNNMITVNNASANFIIKDQSAAGTGKVQLSYSANERRYAVCVTKGHVIVNSGTVTAINTKEYVGTATDTKPEAKATTSCVILVKAGQKCTINGGLVEAKATYNPYAIYSDGANSIITVNGGKVRSESTQVSSPYAIISYGTINVNGGEIEAFSKTTSTIAIYVHADTSKQGTLNMTGGTVTATSTTNTVTGILVNRGLAYNSTTAEPRTIKQEYPGVANISGGTIKALTSGSTTAYGFQTYGTLNISGGEVTVKPKTTTAYGVYLYAGTTTISGMAHIDVQATNTAYGVYSGKYQPHAKGGPLYNGTLEMNGGTLDVKTTTGDKSYGVYVGVSSRNVTTTHATDASYFAGNYANAGTATINGGEINVTAKTSTAYALYVEAALSGTFTGNKTPKCTVNGGKFKVVSTDNSTTNVVINNTDATLANFSMAGGYFNVAPNGTTNIAAGKSVQDVVRAKEQAIYDAGYVKKIRGNEYTVTWKNYNGTTLLGTTQVESGKVPVWTGETPTYNTSTATREFDGWSTQAKNKGDTYLDGAALPAVGAEDVTYYAHYDVIYAEVIAGGTTTRYTSAATAWTNAIKNKNATIRVLSDYSNTKQMVFNPTNANSTIILDLNGHYWSHGTRSISPLLHVNPTQTGCKLIITDNTASGNGYLMNSWEKTDGALTCIQVSKGELVLQGGALKANNTASGQYSVAVQVNGGTQFTMTGGKVYATDGYSPRGINVSPSGNADIVGGTVHADATGGNAYGVLAYGTVAVGGDALVKATTAGSGAYPGYVDGGTLTVADSCSIVATAPSNARDLYVFNAGKITVNDKPTITATVTSGSEAYGCYVSGSGSEIEVNGGTYELTGAAASGSVMGVRAISSGVATINNGTFTLQGGNNWTFGVFAQTGTVNINGGDFTVSQASGGNKEGIRVYPGGTCNITGGTFTVTTIGSSGGNALHAYGGTTNISGNPIFNAYYGVTVADGVVANGATTATVVIDGGTYNTQSFGVNGKTTSRDDEYYTGTNTGDVTVWDGKFKSAAGWNVLDNSSSTECLKIRGGWYSNNSSGKLATGSGNFVVSPSTVEALTSGPEYDAGYRYHVISKYNVTWSINGVNTVQEYSRNETPSYGSTPTIDDGNTWEFLGWSPELAPVTADVTYTAQFRKYEAEVYEGENPTPKRFEHFTDAWSAAKNLPVARVKMLSNVSMSTQLVLTPDSAAGSKPLTLDLNNHTLAYTGTTDRFVIVNKAGCVLKVADSSVANGGVLKYEGSYNGGIYTVVSYSGDIVLESGKIFAKNTYAGKSSRAVTPCGTTTFTMTGGTAEAHAATDARAIAQDGTPSINVSGGKVIAKSYTISGDTVWGSTSYGICMGHGSLSVSGNPIITSDASASALGVYMYNSDASFEIDGGTFTSKAHNGSASYSIYTNTNSVGNIIRGGTFKAIGLNGGQIHAVHAIGSSKIDISGGTFTSHANAGQSHCLFVQSGGTLNVSGGSFTAESDAPSNGNIEAVRMWTGGVVNISGGTFTSTGASNNIALRNLGGTATISGGTFTSGNYTIGVAEAGSIGSVGDVRVNINGGTFISTTNRNIYASTNEGTTSVAVTVNGGYFHSAGTYVVEKAGTATIVLNGGKYNETSGSNHKTNITSYKGSTTTVSNISETVAGKTYVYELLTKFNISWRGGSSYTKDEQIYSGIVPTNNELVGKYFLRNDSAFYFTGWSPTPTAVAGDATYQALGEYHVAKVTVAAKDSIFDDFDEAWNYAMEQTSATITLLSNITRTTSIVYSPENDNARHTLDLNNFTIKENTKDRLLVVNKSDAKLTITDNSSEKGGCLYKKMNSSANMYTTVIYHGELILAGGKLYVENTKDDKEWHPALAVHTSVSTDGIFTMTGGTVESQAKYLAYPIYNYATTNISGGTIIANATTQGSALGFYAVAGTATISGGTFNITASTNAIGAIATGWISADGSNNQQGTLNITGGTFNVSCTTSGAHAVQATGTGKNIGGTYYTSHGIMNVSGGTFNVTCPPIAAATQVFAAQVNAWRQFDDALPHSMVAEAKGEMNISGGTFTVDARNSGAWVTNKGNVDLLRNWGTLNVSGGNFTIHQYSTPSAISVFRGKATVTGNPVFNVYAHTGNAYAVCAGYWTHENYCDKNAANNLAEAEVNGGTFKIITEGQNTNVIYALGQISAESRDGDTITAHAGYAMNAKVTVNGGTFLGICPNESGKYPIMLNSRTDQVGTYGTAKSEIYVTGGKFKSRKGTEADNTTTGAVNCHNVVGTLLLTGGYYETNGQLNAQKADTCIVTNITSAEIDPEYNNGYRYRIDIHYVAQVTATGIDRKFATLKGALDYARTVNNSTVTILNDCDFETDGQYGYGLGTTGKTMTIDLNNHTVNATNSETSYDRVFAVTGQITITDNSVAKGGKLNLTKAHNGTFLGIVFNDASQLTLANGTIYVENTTASKAVEALNIWGTTGLFRQTGGTLQAKATSGTATGVQMRGTAQISGGNITVTSVGSTARAFNQSADAANSKYSSLTVSSTPTITVSGAGEVSGVYANVAGTTTTISGGTWNITSTTSTAYGVRLSKANTATISGGTFNATATTTNAYGIYVSGGGSGTVSGGTFTSRTGANKNESFGAYATGTGTTLNITGGTFDANSADNAGGNINVVLVQPGATVTISGGTFRSGANNGYGLVAFGGVTTVSGTALFEAQTGAYVGSWYSGDGTNDELATVNLNGGTFNVKGVAINATWNTKYENKVYLDSPFSNSIINVNGGRYKTTGGTIVQKKANGADGGTAVLHIAGGYFNEKSGTTFKDQIATYVADTSEINTLDPLLDGIYKYEVAPHYVAKVQTGSTTKYHTTAKAAFDYAKTVANPTITLLDNCTLSPDGDATNYNRLNSNSWTGTLDLNNFILTPTISSEGRAFTVSGTGSKLTITDNSGAKGGKIYYQGPSTASLIYFVVEGSAEVELAAGTLYVEDTSADKVAVGFVVNSSTAKFTQSGGTFTVKGKYQAQGYYGSGTATFSGGSMYVEGETSQAIGLHPNAATAVLNVSGTFELDAKSTNNAYAVYAENGTATIEGTPDFYAESPTRARVLQGTSSGNLTVDGGTFEANGTTASQSDCYVLIPEGTSTFTINGGKFKNNQNNFIYKASGATLTINGGYFNEYTTGTNHKTLINGKTGSGKVVIDLETDDAEYIAGYRYVVTADPVAKVKAGSEVTYYTTIGAAFTAANASTTYEPTIKLLQDAVTTTSSYITYSGAKNCTLNLNGHTLSSTTAQALLNVNKAGITFTITDLTESKSGTLHLESTSTDNRWCVYVANGNLQMDAGTISLHSKANQFNEGVRIDPVASTFTMNGGKVYVVTSDSKTACGIASRGVAVINGGEIQVEASGIGYGIEARVKDTNIGNITVNGGKFLVTGTTAACAYKSAANATLKLQGGYYNSDTNLSTYCATNYHVLPNDDATYPYKVAEAYTLTWNLDGGTVTTAGTGAAVDATGTPSIIWGVGDDITAPIVTKTGYTFAGWSPVVAATMPAANTTYTATWTVNSYTIRFLNYDGSELQSSLVNYGETPVYSGETPSKPADATYTYTFDTWSPAITAVSKAQDYTAQFSQTENVASVTVNSSGYTLYYTDFSKAFKVAKEATVPVTIKLLRDASCSEALQYNSNNTDCTLDLNGHTLTSNTSQSSPLHINKSNATFTITDGTDEKSGKLSMNTSSSTTIFGAYVQYGTLLLNAGTIEVLSGSATTCGVTVHNGSLTMNGGTIHVKTTDGREGRGVYAYASSTTITGGTIHVEAAGDGYGIKRDGSGTGTVTVNGGKFNISASGSAYATNLASANASVVIRGGYYTTNSRLNPIAPYHVFGLDNQSPYLYEVAKGYTLTWTTDGDPLTGTYTSGTTKVGTAIVAPNTPTKTGYTFSAWTPAVAATMPAENTEYTATWTPNTNTAYTVKHYQQNIADDEYTLIDTDNLTGTTDAATEAVAKSYTGFTAQSFSQSTIAPDGSTTVSIYYNRDKFTITWKNADGTTLETDANVKYGALPVYDGTTPTKATDAEYAYTFDTWSPAVSAVTGDAVYTATYTTTPVVASVTANSTTAYYTSFADAWTAANSATAASTLTLLKDISGLSSSRTYSASHNLMLDLNGHTLSGSGSITSLFQIGCAGYTFTVTDGSANHDGKLSFSSGSGSTSHCVIVTNGTFVLEAGTIEATSSTASIGAVQVADGTFTMKENGAVHAKYTGNANGKNSRFVNATGGTTNINGGTIHLESPSDVTDVIGFVYNNGTVTITGGRFNLEAGHTAAVTNKTEAINSLNIRGGYYSANTTMYFEPHVKTPYHIFSNSDATYIYRVAEGYTLTWNLDGGDISVAGTPAGYVAVGDPITAPVVTKTGYTFAGWSPDVPATMPAANTTYTATWTAAESGSYADIVDVDNANSKLIVNVTSWPVNGWPYSINGVPYAKDAREDDRTLKVTYSGAPGDDFPMLIQKTNGDVYSHHTYVIPQEVKSATTLSANETKNLYVKNGATLTVNANISVHNIYVAPDAKLTINSGKTLTADTVFLRTTKDDAAEMVLNGDLAGTTKLVYTRIIKDKDFHLFGLPLPCPAESVHLSDGVKPPYTTGWVLRSYNESRRAESGADGNNWVTLLSDGTIAGGAGYEMFSASNYYREFYFPVSLPTTNKVAVAYTSDGAAGEKQAGWNALVSPFTHTYENEKVPEGLVVNWYMDGYGYYEQEIPSVIPPAKPFAFQTSEAGNLSFESSAIAITKMPRRAVEEEVQIQWINLDLEDANGLGDQTSVYSHPTRYDAVYQTGIDVAKQSFEAPRAILYSSHVYGDMAFAGVADSLLEQGVALTVYSPAAQELTFSMRDNRWLDRMAFVWLIDHQTGTRTDLLWSDYTYDATEGTTRGRFTIQGVFRAPQVATDIDNTDAAGREQRQVRKLIIHDKMYIEVNGQLFDATGKMVNK